MWYTTMMDRRIHVSTFLGREDIWCERKPVYRIQLWGVTTNPFVLLLLLLRYSRVQKEERGEHLAHEGLDF